LLESLAWEGTDEVMEDMFLDWTDV